MKRMQVVLGFDMETDVGSWTPFYEGLKNGTPVILDVLDRRQVTGTFFFTGDAARKHPMSSETLGRVGTRLAPTRCFMRPLAIRCSISQV